MIETGSAAPDFRGTTQDGKPIALSAYRGRPVVLYFYPKANTTGCTLEARGFAEHYPDLQKAGAEVIGVSVDSIESQKSFSEKCHLPFPLVADRDKSIAKQYGVLGLLGIAKRVTFLLDANGKVVERVEGMMPGRHVERAVARLAAPAAPG
jgi:thioredoxin-dependent peroxiredoxin